MYRIDLSLSVFRNVSAREDIKENSKTTLLQLEDHFRLHIFVTYITPCSWYSSIRLGMPSKKKKKLSDICQNSNIPSLPTTFLTIFHFDKRTPSLPQFGQIFVFSECQFYSFQMAKTVKQSNLYQLQHNKITVSELFDLYKPVILCSMHIKKTHNKSFKNFTTRNPFY